MLLYLNQNKKSIILLLKYIFISILDHLLSLSTFIHLLMIYVYITNITDI